MRSPQQRLGLTQTQRLSLNTSLQASIALLRTDAAGLTRYLEEQAAENPNLRLEPPPDPALQEWLPRWTSVLSMPHAGSELAVTVRIRTAHEAEPEALDTADPEGAPPAYRSTEQGKAVKLELSEVGTTAGLRKFCAGEIPIANASRPIRRPATFPLSWSRRLAMRKTGCAALIWGPMTIWPNPFTCASSRPACGPCCVGRQAFGRRSSVWGRCRWI